MRLVTFCLTLWLSASPLATPLAAQDALGLVAPPDVTETGLLKHILPRFSLKTGVRVRTAAQGEMELANTPPGTPVFRGPRHTWHLRISTAPKQQRFLDWLTSDIGRRTIEAFEPANGAQAFSTEFGETVAQSAAVFEGDAARGAELALSHCGRCHVVSEANRSNGIGSTPCFGVLRSLPDWNTRFESFYVLKPHGAFTQVDGVTPPFDPERPPPIVPVEVTVEEVDAILAFVSELPPTDLGAPLKTQ